jgi:predicted nuclease with TOPRIM domain
MGTAIALLTLILCSLGLLYLSRHVAVWADKSIKEISEQEEALAQEYKDLKKRKAALNSEIQGLEQKIFLLENDWVEPTETVPLPKAKGTSAEKTAAQWLLSSGKLTLEQFQKAQKLTGKLAQDFVETCIVLDFLDEDAISSSRKIMRTGVAPSKDSKAKKN